MKLLETHDYVSDMIYYLFNSALPDELGYDVQPATNTNFGLSEVLQTRLEAPYISSCYSNWTQTNYTDFLGK